VTKARGRVFSCTVAFLKVSNVKNIAMYRSIMYKCNCEKERMDVVNMV